MIEELEAINRNNTCELIKFPANKKVIDVKFVFKLKLKPNGEISKHKERLVARGFMQKVELDYSKVYALVARLETIILIVAIARRRKQPIYHLDVKLEFLNGLLDEVVYVTQPPEFKVKGNEDMIFRVHKVFFGLKQVQRA